MKLFIWDLHGTLDSESDMLLAEAMGAKGTFMHMPTCPLEALWAIIKFVT